MKYLAALILPALLGVAAFLVHYNSQPKATNVYCEVSSSVDSQFASDSETLKQQIVPGAPRFKAIRGAVLWSDRGVLLGRPVTRQLRESDLVLYSDLLNENRLQPMEGFVAINVSLQGISYEPRFLRVGSEIGFVVEEFDDDTGQSIFRLLKKFKVLAVDNIVTDSLGSDFESANTICIEASEELDEMQELLRHLRDETIVALAFEVQSPETE